MHRNFIFSGGVWESMGMQNIDGTRFEYSKEMHLISFSAVEAEKAWV